ncbi:MAG: sulfite exporter TauE/SafE family protein [Chitinophagaceae bacterium]
MNLVEIVGYVSAIGIGISLGLIGGGGSILTVPVLVYLFSIEPIIATTYSLFVVGITSVVGSISYFKKGLINIKTAVAFGLSSIFSVMITRLYIVKAIPDSIIEIGNFVLTKNIFLMLFFAVLMIAASFSMIKKQKNHLSTDQAIQEINYIQLIIQGLIVGLLTGIVGAGGGFLIIPALVLVSKLSMKEAIGTALAIIAANTLIGFFSAGNFEIIQWPFLLSITSLAIVGIFIGIQISKKINGAKLKPAFGWFVLVMGMYIISKEIFF